MRNSIRARAGAGAIALALAAPAPCAAAAASTSSSGVAASGSASSLTTTATPARGASGALGVKALRRSVGHAARKGRGARHVSAPAIVVGALGALLVLGAACWAIARRRAFEPRWWLSMRHCVAEAGHRASATWSELGDWARLGR